MVQKKENIDDDDDPDDCSFSLLPLEFGFVELVG